MYSCLKGIKRENRLLLSQLTKHQAGCSISKTETHLRMIDLSCRPPKNCQDL